MPKSIWSIVCNINFLIASTHHIPASIYIQFPFPSPKKSKLTHTKMWIKTEEWLCNPFQWFPCRVHVANINYAHYLLRFFPLSLYSRFLFWRDKNTTICGPGSHHIIHLFRILFLFRPVWKYRASLKKKSWIYDNDITIYKKKILFLSRSHLV